MKNLCAIFKLFSLAHFIYLFVAIAIAVALILVLRNIKEDYKKIARIILAFACLTFVLFEFIGRIVCGVDNIFENLPLEPIGVFAVICVINTFRMESIWTKFAYFIMIPISVYQMIFVPNYYCTLGSLSIPILSFYFAESMIIAYALLSVIWTNTYLEKKDIVNVSLNYLIVVGCVHIVNVIISLTELGPHSSYFGTTGENYDLVIGALESLLKIPFVCILPLLLILFGFEFLIWIPFEILKNRKEKKDQYNELIALGNMKAQQEHRKGGKSSGSQVLVRSETKASPTEPKRVSQGSSDGRFINTQKVINVNNTTNNTNAGNGIKVIPNNNSDDKK